jgi:hypothetical protein
VTPSNPETYIVLLDLDPAIRLQCIAAATADRN